jgi:hypothetical protein
VGRSHAVSYQPHVAALLALLAEGREGVIHRLAMARQQAADTMRFERAQHVHRVLTALEQATIGKPLALTPVDYRNMVVIVGPRHGGHDVFLIRRGRFAGRISMSNQRPDAQAFTDLLASSDVDRDGRSRAGEMVVDELRIVASWLQRTRAYACWIPFAAEMNPTEVLAVIKRALPPIAPSSSGGSPLISVLSRLGMLSHDHCPRPMDASY